MKAVIDEGVPRRLAKLLASHDCDVSAFPKHLRGLKNGILLAQLANAGFDCLLTCDKNLVYQQNVMRSGMAVIVLPFQRFEAVAPFAKQIVEALKSASRGAVLDIGIR